MGQSFMQDSLTTLVLLHLHQQLSQVIAQEVLLLSFQSSLIVVYCLHNSRLASMLVCLCVTFVYLEMSAHHKP